MTNRGEIMKTIKKAIALLIALMLIASALPFNAFADDRTGDGLSGTWCNGTWKIASNNAFSRVLTISGVGEMDSAEIEDNAGNVMTFAELAVSKNVLSICFNEGVYSIADNFMYINDETTIPIQVISLPQTMRSIGNNAFRHTDIKQLLPKSIYSMIYESSNYNLLQMLGFPKLSMFSENISYIGSYAFADTTSFYNDEIMLPKHLTSVEEGCFYNCNMCSVISYTTIKSFAKKSFSNCKYLQKIYAPITLESIYEDPVYPENNAFGYLNDGSKNSGSLMDGMPPGLTVQCEEDSLGYDYATRHGFNIEIGNTGSYDNGEVSVEGCENVLGYNYYIESGLVTLMCGQRVYSTIAQLSYFTGQYNPHEEFVGALRSDQAVVSSRVNYYAGFDNFDPTSILLGGTVEFQFDDVEPGYFDTKLVQLEEGITKLQASNVFEAFDPEAVALPSSLRYLDYDVFGNCHRLKYVSIPNSVTHIGSKVFVNCPNLEGVELGDGITVVPTQLFYNCKSLCYVDIGESVKTISEKAFSNCTSLETIAIPDSVETIESEAFNNCIDAISLDLGKGVNKIGSGAFSDCLYCETVNVNSNLTAANAGNAFVKTGNYTEGVELSFGDEVSDVDFEVFKGAKITSVKLGKNVKNIKGVQYLNNLKTIEVNGENPYFYTEGKLLYSNSGSLVLVPRTLDNFEIKSGISSIGDYACYATNAVGVKIPASVRTVGKYAFASASSLRSVSMYNGLLNIEEGAFKGCIKLRVLFFPESLTSIGESAFEGCERLSGILLNESLESISAKAFYACPSIKGIVLPESLLTLGDMAFAECKSLEYAYIWRTVLGNDVFLHDPFITIYTLAGSNAWAYGREYDQNYTGYTDEDLFFVEAGLKRDEEAGYAGICEGDHGDIEWLTIYDADCENEGYMIGVCEYCSEVLEERYVSPYGHSYEPSSYIPPTATQRGMQTYKCSRCMAVKAEFIAPNGTPAEQEPVYTVSGRILISNDKRAESGINPARNAAVQLDGVTVARTNDNGEFSFEVNSGVNVLKLHYAFGFDRYVYTSVDGENLNTGDIIIIGCDFNRDGKINDEDEELFSYILSSEPDDPSYMSYADMNNDGYINGKDFAIVHSCKGINKNTFRYTDLVFD